MVRFLFLYITVELFRDETDFNLVKSM
uniref:Uncharacterized protein n=1 Tax=Anguilla anguilla TaxID=7936 RepID=A0A0E9TPR1_ANGAN